MAKRHSKWQMQQVGFPHWHKGSPTLKHPMVAWQITVKTVILATATKNQMHKPWQQLGVGKSNNAQKVTSQRQESTRNAFLGSAPSDKITGKVRPKQWLWLVKKNGTGTGWRGMRTTKTAQNKSFMANGVQEAKRSQSREILMVLNHSWWKGKFSVFNTTFWWRESERDIELRVSESGEVR